MEETTIAQIDMLRAERRYHISHVNALNLRVAFVAVVFAGLVLFQAVSLRLKAFEASVAALADSAQVAGEKVQKRLVPAVVQFFTQEIPHGEQVDQIREVFREAILDAASEVPPIRLSNSMHWVILLAGVGFACVIGGLYLHTRLHLQQAYLIGRRMAQMHTTDSAPSCSSEHLNYLLFLGIGAVAAAGLVATFILMCPDDWGVLTGLAIGPAIIAGILAAVSSYRHPVRTPPDQSLHLTGS